MSFRTGHLHFFPWSGGRYRLDCGREGEETPGRALPPYVCLFRHPLSAAELSHDVRVAMVSPRVSNSLRAAAAAPRREAGDVLGRPKVQGCFHSRG
jgi:hypothetical protein